MGPFLLGAVKILLAVQATQATVAGTVRDEESGEPLAGAVVTLIDLDRATTTNANGRYVLREVPAGPQHITVRFIGHAPRTLHALVPRDGQLEINVSLRAEPFRLKTLEVRPLVAVRGIDSGDSTAFPDRGTSIAAVRNHPLLSEPDFFQALGGGEVVLRPESPSGVHIRGGASDQIAYLLDGVPVFSPYHAAGVFSAWNPDALSRLELSSAAPSPEYPDALSGAIAAETRTPGSSLRTQGSASTTQARLTVDGPAGVAGAGFLLSWRSTFPGVDPPKDASYVRSQAGDWLAKLEVPAFGGGLRLLGYENDNEISSAAVASPGDKPTDGAVRNVFEWHSQSFGAEWKRVFSSTSVRVQGWNAAADAGSGWTGQVDRLYMTADRRDQGLLAAVEHSSARASTVVGVRLERSRTSYRVEHDSAALPSLRLSGRTPVTAAFAQHSRTLGSRIGLNVAASLASARGDLYLAPRAQLQWKMSERLTLSSNFARLYQFAQSLRNAESVVGNVFPVDLYMGVGAPGVPVARSDQVVIAADYRPLSGVRLGIQAYERDFDGLLLVAPGDGEPFSTGAFATGSGAARGLSVDAAMTTTRYGLLASYGLQRVRLNDEATSYVPDHGAIHLIEGGVIVFPTATSSVRIGAASVLGRRTTTVSSGFEWESCNLVDKGCEFGGSPHYGGSSLGAAALPSYLRVDLGFRKHWHLEPRGRDLMVALFGTVTNVFGRSNLLTFATDPSTGKLVGIEMRPLSPLVVGLDWQF